MFGNRKLKREIVRLEDENDLARARIKEKSDLQRFYQMAQQQQSLSRGRLGSLLGSIG